jgi:hypothetical protein
MRPLALATILIAASACDDDPSGIIPELNVTCPATALPGVGELLTLTFNQPISQASAQSAGNIVLSEATTGVEVPAAPIFDPTNPTIVSLRTASPLAYGSRFRLRVQNVTNLNNQALSRVTLCQFTTPNPLITQVFWRPLPSAGGGSIRGVSVVSPTLGYVTSVNQPLFRREGAGPFIARPAPFFFTNLFDVSFVSPDTGFVTLDEPGQFRSSVSFTMDGGLNYTQLYTVANRSTTQSYFRRIGTGATSRIFGVSGGGPTPYLIKYLPPAGQPGISGGTTEFIALTGGTQVRDVDFTPDTTLGAAVTLGTATNPGRLFVTRDGGRTWTVVANSNAPANVTGYRGVGISGTGTARSIVVAGPNGYVARFDEQTGGTFSAPQVITSGINTVPNPTPTDPFALVYSDIDFADDNPSVGWLTGLVQTGTAQGTTRFRGLIFETRDGGRTFLRQGVQDAGVRGTFEFGADFEALNRVQAKTATLAWASGEGGLVIEYSPSTAPQFGGGGTTP